MEITEIKQQLTIGQVLTHYNLKPDRNNMLHCPFHDDKTPSLQIYPKTNTFCCFSSNCSAGNGDVIDFIQLKEQCNKHEALIMAKQMLGVNNNSLPHTSSGGQSLSRTAILAKFYTSSLLGMSGSKKARAYAESRNLDWQTAKIGCIGGDISKKWSETYKKQAEQVGLLKRNTAGNYQHHFKNALVFPLMDPSGQIVSVYGRRIESKDLSADLSDRSETKAGAKGRHIYLKGERQGLYPKYPAPETEILIFTESVIDAASLSAVTLEKAGLATDHAVLALYGTNGFTAEHAEAIRSLPNLKEIILFLDGDTAGRAAVEKLRATLQSLSRDEGNGKLRPELTISAVETPEGEDINSLAVSHEPEIFDHLIENRKVLSSPDSYWEEIKEKPQRHKPTTGQPTSDKLSTENLANATLRTENPELLYYNTENLLITVLGGIKITGLDRLRVTLKIEPITTERLLPIRHSLDLYHSKQVADLVRQISEQYEQSRQEVHYIIAALTTALEHYRNSRLEAMKPKKPTKKNLTPAEEKAALDYLKDEKLMLNTLKDIKASGIIGEERNAMIAFVAYLSRKREKPLNIMCLGASGSGKTYLQEKIGGLVPEEDKLEITMLSENAFYYFGKEELKHKLILIEDLDGAENVLYPLRELQSKRRISKTVTLKDNKGNLKTMTLEVEGPVCVSSCTTREKIYEDNANRCLLLYIDTSKEQDKRITDYQRAESAGQINHHAEAEIKEKFKNIQRLLKPIKVVNPYAQFIDLPDEVFKPRRSMVMLLSFIETITFYHQYQREVRTDHETGQPYIESTKEDVEKGFNLLRDVLFSKSDELSGACRSFLEKLKKEVHPEQPFYKKEIREKLRINPNNLKRYLRELMAYGHLEVTGGNRHRGYQYQLTNREEYDQLKSRIGKKLDDILKTIKGESKNASASSDNHRSGSVGQRGSVNGMTHLTA